MEDELSILFERLFAVLSFVLAIGLKICLQVADGLLAVPQRAFLHEIVESSKLIVVIFLELFLHQLLVESRELSHLVDHLVVNRHRVKANDESDDLRLYFPNFLEELQLPYFRDGDPLGRISHKHLLDDLNRFDADIAWKDIKALYDFFVEFLRSLLLKGQSAADHPIEDNPQGPHISDDAVVGLPRHHFRRRVAGTPAGSGEQFPALIVVGESEVDELDVVVSIEQDIFWL